jgi:hypothetical protein
MEWTCEDNGSASAHLGYDASRLDCIYQMLDWDTPVNCATRMGEPCGCDLEDATGAVDPEGPLELKSCVQHDTDASLGVSWFWVKLDNFTLDLSIIEAISEIDMALAMRLEYDYEITDLGLLPLSRLDRMLSCTDDELLPPIRITRSMSKWQVIDGRHRFARALLRGATQIRATTGRDDYLLSGGESNPGPPRRDARREQGGRRHDLRKNIEAEVVVHHDTRIYLRGRDQIYPDAAALARFNDWTERHLTTIDPAEQFFCRTCGHVGFLLCAHSVTQVIGLDDVSDDEQIVAPVLRKHVWGFKLREILRKAFKWPAFDTHSPHDDSLNGFSNEHLNQDLIINQLFAYLVLHQQTSYVVTGKDDRGLRLAHTHRLAERWLISSGNEKLAETDLHYSVRVRFTIQRATDNMQNSMLYEQRNPSWNFGSAWLPKSRWSQLIFSVIAVSLVIWSLATCLSWAGTVLPAASAANMLSWTLLNGNMPSFECTVAYSYSLPGKLQHVAYVTQSCEFTDWVTLQWNVVLSCVLEMWKAICAAFLMHHENTCFKLQMDVLVGQLPITQWQRENWGEIRYQLHVMGLKISPWLSWLYRC